MVEFTLTERVEPRETSRLFFMENDRIDLVGEGRFNFTASGTSSLSTVQTFVTVS